jgi:phosphate starvation-inducible PhoH-like protein
LGVKVTTREGWVKLEGDSTRVDKAQQVFQQLEQARQQGVDIQKHEFNYTLKAVTEERDENLRDIVSTKIVTSSRKPPVVARSANQRAYVEAIQKHDVVFGIGPAGTGKTYLAVAMAVAALKKEQVARIILTRPAVEAGEALGFLPGDLEQKILPYLRPLYDALHEMLEPEEMERAIARQTIEVAPLAYMRGRTLSNAFVILDEAQNTTNEQMFMLLTRIGLNSKCVVTGDVTQIDLPANKRSGVLEALQALKNVPGIATVYFTERDVVRHELVRAIIGAYQAHRGPAPESRQ